MSERRKIMSVVGTRPNFMKTAPVIRELEERSDDFEHLLVHTGQHYGAAMSQVFLDELAIGEPDHFLGIGSGSHAQQIARVMERLEPVLLEEEPDLVLVPGDVNSTLAAALAAATLGIPIAHIEAGLRSFDRTMQEETNRVVVDSLSALLFTHSPEALGNLVSEGCDERAVHYVGNTMIDTLTNLRERIEALDAPGRNALARGMYIVVTLHRPALVGHDELLASVLRRLVEISADYTVVFPVHPRTRAAIQKLGILSPSDRLRLLPPLGYLEFLGLLAGAAGAITDSGGIQEETTFLGVPCFTLRANTERPITVEMGTNTLLGLAPERIAEVPSLIDRAARSDSRVPPLWDGSAAKRLVDTMVERLEPRRYSGNARSAANIRA